MIVNTSGSHQESPSRTVAQGLWPFVPIGIATISLSALLYYHFHQLEFTPDAALQHLYAWIYRSFGLAPSFLFFLLVLMWSTIWLLTGELQKPGTKLLRIAAMAVLVGIFLNLGEGGVSPGLHKGALGAWFADGLYAWFGYVPSLVLVFAMTFASMLLATDFFFSDGFERLRQARTGAFDQGVEDEVTERLRSLAMPVSPPSLPRVDAVVAEPVVPADVDVADRPEVFDEVAEVEPLAQEPIAVPSRRRSSYFERRRERFGAAADEDWEPPAPESTEIDNPESRDPVEAGEAAAPAPVVASTTTEESSSEVQDAWVAAESLMRERAPEPVADLAPVEPPESAEVAPESASRTVSDFGETFLDEREPEALPPRWAHAIDLGGPEPVAEPAAETVAEPQPEAVAEVAPTVEAIDDLELPPMPEESEAVVEPLVDDEPLVAIPRPEAAVPVEPEPAVEPRAAAGFEPQPEPEPEPVLVPVPEPAKQQNLFGAGVDEALLQEAIELVTEARRASVAFLQRKLRIDYDLAAELMQELAARGVIAVEGDASRGRDHV